MKNRFYQLMAGCAMLSASLNVSAQTGSGRTCSSMELLESQLAANPNMKQQRAAIEAYTQTMAKPGRNNQRTGIITIPVVVHVVYNTTQQNISDAQIQSQIDVLNRDFRKLNPDAANTPSVFAGLAADAQIEFCLAKRDPNGNATNGITRTQTTRTSFTNTSEYIKYTSQGGKDAWDRNQYLNLWVGNLGGGLLGYAQFPGGPTATDGVVCTYTGFGTTGTASAPFNLGRTATHEVGHWLNLYHIWGDDNTACNGTDECADTPNQGGYNTGCPSFPKISCSNTPNGDMWMNYMDYTDDRCMYMFTTGQKARMDAVVGAGGFRASLATSLGCVAPSEGTACAVPSGLTTSALAETTVTLNWAASSGASGYSVQIKAAASTTWSTFSATSNTISFTGLTTSTAYEFKVAGVCAGITGAYSATASFNTPGSGTATGNTITVGTGTTAITQAPYGTYYMDQRVQYIITNAELKAAGYTSGSSLSSLGFYVTAAQSQVMNGYTIKISHTTSSAFGSTSYLSGSNTTTVFAANYTATSNSWNTHNFTTPFAYNGTGNILIDICFNNSSYTQNSTVTGTSLSAYRALYKQQDVASGGICNVTKGARSYSRPNIKLSFGSGSRTEELVLGDALKTGLTLYPNPASNELNLGYTLESDQDEVELYVYNLVGDLIFTQKAAGQKKGENSIKVSLNYGNMANLPNGLYICRLKAGETTRQARFILTR